MCDALTLLKLVGGTGRDGKLPAFTSLGSYPLFYVTDQCALLCSDCATTDYFDWLYALTVNRRDLPFAIGYDDPPTSVSVNWEGPDETCDNCNKTIPTAYGNPWEGEDK